MSNRKKQPHHFAKSTLYILTARFIFALSGWIIHLGLARSFSSSQYGTFGVILSVINILQMFLIKGIPDATTKYLAEGIDGYELKKKAFLLQSIYTAIISLLLLLSTPTIAYLLNDKSLEPLLLILPLVIFGYSFKTLYAKLFGGYREFGMSSKISILAAISRIFFVFTFVYWGFGVSGAILGYASSAFLAVIYSSVLFKPKRGKKPVTYRKICNFGIPIIIFSVLFNILTVLDLFFIKSLLTNDSYVGYYTSARMISTLYVIVSISFSATLLPSISNTYSKKKKLETKSYIVNSLRYTFMLFLPTAVIISSNAKEIISLLFTSEYSKAANALSILIFAWLFLYIFYIFTSIINASGKSKIPAFLSGIAIVLSFISNYFLVNHFGMVGGALATFITGVFCFLGGIFYMHRIFKVSIEISSLLRIISASLIILLISLSINIGGILLIFWCIVLFSIYLGILLLIGEINKEDIKLAKDLLKSLSFKN